MKIQPSHVAIGVLGVILFVLLINSRGAPKMDMATMMSAHPTCDKTGHHITANEEEAYRYLQLRASQRSMLPVTNAFLNAYIIVGEMTLLEDHLQVPGMLCVECIARKHIPKIRAYAAEAIGLVTPEQVSDPSFQTLIKDMQDLSENMVELQIYFMEDPKGHALHCGQMVRRMRKYLSHRYGVMNASLAYHS